MLKVSSQGTAGRTVARPQGKVPTARRSRLARALRVEWLGQTVASVCWIASVFAYGMTSTGDWLQLFAASTWLVANVASLATGKEG